LKIIREGEIIIQAAVLLLMVIRIKIIMHPSSKVIIRISITTIVDTGVNTTKILDLLATQEIFNLKSPNNQQQKNYLTMKVARLVLVDEEGSLHLPERETIVMDLGQVVALEGELVSIQEDL
jgi:hypothetical protein